MDTQYSSSSCGFRPERDPRRGMAIFGVIAVHAVAVFALTHGFRVETPKNVSAFQVALISEEVRPEDPNLPPPPSPEVETPQVMLDMPQINLPVFVEPQQAITVASPPPQLESVVAEPVQTMPKLVSAVEFLKPLRPEYPQISRRMREEGLVILKVLVDRQGRACQIEVHRSSGHDRLDKAATSAASHARFKPYIEGGVIQAAFVLIPVEFTLTHRVAARR